MPAVNLSPTDTRYLDKALQLLRDRHYRSYSDSPNRDGDTAQGHLKTYEQLDQLRFRIINGGE